MATTPAVIRNGAYAPTDTTLAEGAVEVAVTGSQYAYLSSADYADPTTAAFNAGAWGVSAVLSESLTVPQVAVGVHMIRTYNYGYANLTPCGSARMHDTGCRWDQIETADGVYDWSTMDQFVAAFAGKEIVFTLYGTPVFHSTDNPPTLDSPYSDGAGGYVKGIASNPTPSGLTALTAFITALVTRYTGQVKAIEVWNEPNAGNWWRGTQQELANMIRTVSVAAKAVDPTIKIISPATVGWVSTGNAKAYAQAVLGLTAAGDVTAIHNRVDVFGVHLYGSEVSVGRLRQFITDVKAVKTALGMSQPIWDTESGLLQLASGSSQSGYTDDAYYHRMLAHYFTALAAGVERVFWYTTDHPYMGFLDRPAVTAQVVAALTALLGTPVRVFQAGGEVVVQRVSDDLQFRF